MSNSEAEEPSNASEQLSAAKSSSEAEEPSNESKKLRTAAKQRSRGSKSKKQ